MNLSRKVVSRLFLGVLVATLVLGGSAFASSKNKKDKSKDSTTQQQSGKVDLNTASEKDLDALPGVGPATAKKIVAGRPYSSVDDLKKAGVSAATIEKMRGQVTVSAASAAKPSAAVAATTPQATEPTPPATASKGKMRPEEKQSGAVGNPQSDAATATPPPAGSGMVWANPETKVYHREGDRWYGKTKHGKYMTEGEAQAEGYRPSKEK